MNVRMMIKEACRGELLQNTADLSALYRQARLANSGFEKFLSALAKEVGAAQMERAERDVDQWPGAGQVEGEITGARLWVDRRADEAKRRIDDRQIRL